jgi:NADP-dependent 3-hydroxy acid dehydrogenase YdfG
MTRIDDLRDRAVLITGASSGIGAAVMLAHITGNMIHVNGGMYMP